MSRSLVAQGQCDAMDSPRCLTSLMASAGPARTLRVNRLVPKCAASAPKKKKKKKQKKKQKITKKRTDERTEEKDA